jgi:linoleoyl-CoA desaturase
MSQPLLRFIDPERDGAVFFATLRQRVDAYFKAQSLDKHSDKRMVIKTIFMLALYIVPFLVALFLHPVSWVTVMLGVLMGLGLAGIGMCIMHDAVHGAYSRSHKINKLIGYSIHLLGASLINWKIQHNVLHHTYTNVVTHDEDIQDKLILRFSPHTEIKWYHKIQVVYAFLFYSLMTLYWTTVKDFVQFQRYYKKGLIKEKDYLPDFLKLVLGKLAYFIVILILPVYLFDCSWLQTLLLFLSMHFVAGIVLTIVFQLAHTVDETSYPLPDDLGVIHNNWAVHQLQTTVDFARDSKILTWYLGGLNFQIEHHLFPSICHVHYPAIAKIVESTASEFGIPYYHHPTLLSAVQSHLQALVKFGKLPHPSEAIV